MIRRKTLPEQAEFWIAREELPDTAKDSFYDQLAADLDRIGFGDIVRDLCAHRYSDGAKGGRPPVDPEVYFKMLVVGVESPPQAPKGGRKVFEFITQMNLSMSR